MLHQTVLDAFSEMGPAVAGLLEFPEDGCLTLADGFIRSSILSIYGGSDFWTGEPLTIEDMVLDHVVPVSLGGPDHAYNVVPTTGRINSAKLAKFDPIGIAAALSIIRVSFGPRLVSLLRKEADRRAALASGVNRSRNRTGHQIARVGFIRVRSEVMAMLEAGWPARAIYRHLQPPGISYRQFLRYASSARNGLRSASQAPPDVLREVVPHHDFLA